MKIVAWTKNIAGDSESILEDLESAANIPMGKRVVRGSDGDLHEIDVWGPNVPDEEFAKYNVCPVNTIEIGNACLAEARTTEPFDPPRPKDPLKVLSGCYGEDTHCPRGWILGQKTNKIQITGTSKQFKSAGIVAGPADNGVDYLESRTLTTGPQVKVKSKPICLQKEDMPLEKRWIEIVTDSIIGWGGYQEFPWWDMNWDMMLDIADARYQRGAELIEKKGFAVCRREYNDDYCLLFDDKDEAESMKKTLDYYDSNEFTEDTKQYLQDEFIGEKIEKFLPEQQKKLDEYTKIKDIDSRERLFKKMQERFKTELDEEITDEKVEEQMNSEKEYFWDDLPHNPHFMGQQSRDTGRRWEDVFIVGKRENSKWREKVVIAEDIL